MRRLLIIGCGDVGLRLAAALRGRWRTYALTHSPDRFSTLRAEGVMPVSGDLDHPESLVRIAGLAQDVVHLAPPPGSGIRDARTTNLIRALAKGGRDRKSTRLNSSHQIISYAVFCLKKKNYT